MKPNTRLKEVEALRWPQNRLQLALLSLENLQAWYAAQNPKDMVFTANSAEFKRFWHWAYVMPTRFYRVLLKIKQFCYRKRSEQVAA